MRQQLSCGVSRQFSNISRVSSESWKSVKSKFSWFSRKDSRTEKFTPLLTVQSIRAQVLNRIQGNKENFHEKDVQTLLTKDRFVQRFIIDHELSCNKPEEGKVVEAVIDCMLWRKNFGINDMKISDYPAELFASNIFSAGELLDTDTVVIYLRGNRYRKVDEWTDIQLEMLLKSFEDELHKYPDHAVIKVVIDCGGCGLANADLSFAYKAMPIVFNYYPQFIKKIYFCNLPWILKPFCQMFVAFLPERFKCLVEYTDSKSLKALIGEENVPDFLGGPAKIQSFVVPADASSIEQVAQVRGISLSNMKKMRKNCEWLLANP